MTDSWLLAHTGYLLDNVLMTLDHLKIVCLSILGHFPAELPFLVTNASHLVVSLALVRTFILFNTLLSTLLVVLNVVVSFDQHSMIISKPPVALI